MMKFSMLVLLAVVGLLVLFSAVNWGVMSAPVELSLLVGSVQAPLGVVMLGFAVLIMVVHFALLLFAQGNALLESRRSARELQAQRELADKAEASRFTDLQAFLRAELDALNARVVSMEQELRREVDESANALAASLGEIEDRLERAGTLPRT